MSRLILLVILNFEEFSFLDFWYCSLRLTFSHAAWKIDLTEVLREYQLSFSKGADNDLLGNYFGPLENHNIVFFYRLFRLRRMCKDTFWVFCKTINDLLGNYFGTPGNPNLAFLYRLFGLWRICEEIFGGF